MYYTYFSTGNMKIDNEHANIDSLILFCQNQTGSWLPEAKVILSSLASHFDSEERICRKEGLNMTDAHRNEHRLLKTRIAVIEQLIDQGELAKEIFLNTLRDLLFYHISEYDKYLDPNLGAR